MRKTSKTIVSAALLSVCLGTVVLAASGICDFRGVAIIANGVRIAEPGDTYVLPNGCEAPYSIIYQDELGGGTTYLSVRKMADLLGVDIGWDADTSSVKIGREIPYNGDYAWLDNGASYTFHMENGVPSDIVDVSLPSGTFYHGQYSGTALTGYGTMTFPGIGVYTGDLVDGQKDGYGTFLWNDGPRYIGEWEEDVMSGEGIYYYDVGVAHKLVGTFEDNVPNGTLDYYDVNGIRRVTIWDHGTCVGVR